MSYENAPATQLLATHCAACGRPLLDASSVQAGMGPDCRRKYGLPEGLSEDARALANEAIHQASLAATAGASQALAASLATLRGLGAHKVADRIQENTATVRMARTDDGRIAVFTPYDDRAVAAFRAIPGRRWDRERKAWTFGPDARPALWRALRALWPGQVGIAPDRTPFVIPASK